MSISGITFSGLASGLDTRAIIDALMGVQRKPVLLLERQKILYRTQKNLFGDLGKKLDAFADAAEAIRTAGEFVAAKATTDRADYLDVSAKSGAAAGTYDIFVDRLATAEVKSSLGKADKDQTAYGAGTISFTLGGDNYDVTIEDGSSTLQDIAAAINASTDLPVQAQVIDTGIGASPYQLVLTGRDTGADGAFTVSASGDPALTALVSEIDANQIVAAQNSSIRFNSIQVERSSNTLTDVVEGLTIDLKAANAAESTKVVVSTDMTATGDKIQKFVDAYNDILGFVDGQSVAGKDGSASSALFGDSTLRRLRSDLRSILNDEVKSVDPQYSVAAFVGLTTDREGQLEFNRSKFEGALADDEAAVRGLFTNADGIAVRIFDRLDAYTDPVDGAIKARTQGLDRLLKRADDQIGRHELRLEQVEANLVRRFANLESLMNSLKSQGSALSAFTPFNYNNR